MDYKLFWVTVAAVATGTFLGWLLYLGLLTILFAT